ncbi:hypothetical protein DFJ77DRAFT_437558 [Powellomyces hirtus]|nr:hypothetical protein DFJ77DRAFT_437558 [Powellomyces hirtus]
MNATALRPSGSQKVRHQASMHVLFTSAPVWSEGTALWWLIVANLHVDVLHNDGCSWISIYLSAPILRHVPFLLFMPPSTLNVAFEFKSRDPAALLMVGIIHANNFDEGGVVLFRLSGTEICIKLNPARMRWQSRYAGIQSPPPAKPSVIIFLIVLRISSLLRFAQSPFGQSQAGFCRDLGHTVLVFAGATFSYSFILIGPGQFVQPGSLRLSPCGVAACHVEL